MIRLVLCFSVWTIIFTCLSLRLVVVIKKAIEHLQRLHQIPCDKCAYFTGDYRLKCTVNPVAAMSENAIGCRDFLYDNQRRMCNGCQRRSPKGYTFGYGTCARRWTAPVGAKSLCDAGANAPFSSCQNQCSDSRKIPPYSQLKAKFINLCK